MKIFIIVLVVFLTACSTVDKLENVSDSFEVIPVDFQKDNNVKVIIKDVIQLESKEEAFMNGIRRLEIYNDNIFVQEKSNSRLMFLFDISGNFINKIKTGRGPGEGIFLTDFYINKQKETLVTWDGRLKRFNLYDLNLGYISTRIFEKPLVKDFIKTEKNNWFVVSRTYQSNYNLYDIKYAHVFDGSFEHLLNSYIPIPKSLDGLSLSDPVCRNCIDLLFTKQFDNNIYEYLEDEDSIKIKYKVDFGNLNIVPEDYLNKPDQYPFELSRNGKRVVSIQRLISNEKWLAFSCYHESKFKFVIYSKESGKVFTSDGIDSNLELPYFELMGYYNNKFVALVEPGKFLEYMDDRITDGNNLPNVFSDVDNLQNYLLFTFQLD